MDARARRRSIRIAALRRVEDGTYALGIGFSKAIRINN